MKFRPTAPRSKLILAAATCILLSMSGCKRHPNRQLERAHHHKPNTTTDADRIHHLISSPTLSTLRSPNFAADQPVVQKFYADRDGELAWTRHDHPTPQANALLQLFHDAALKGLNPEDYDAGAGAPSGAPDRWKPRLQQLNTIAQKKDDSSSAHLDVATFDVAMTISAMRYLEDLHLGRINPESLNFDIDVPTRRAAFDVATLLNDQIVDANDLPTVIASIEPQSPIYQATEQALPHYMALAAQQAAAPTPPLPALPTGEKPVAIGGHYAAIPQLWARLQLEGEAPPPGSTSGSTHPAKIPSRYNAAVAVAVKRYQRRHGLQPDGHLGPATIDSLNIPMSVRVRQIDDALERWRWLPDNYIQPRLFVNLPEFMLRAYDPEHELDFKMRVVDGEVKGDHDTPMFVRLMRYVVFRPYWNLPPSIVKKDLMPHIRRSGLAYLANNDYEAYKADGTVVTNYTVHDIEHARYSVRQKPGPKNSLGLVKFLFPNAYDVYMHSTPELNLFDLTRRDRSHGCVRLQHADQMALWVLYGDQRDPEAENGWDADKIDLAMTGPLNNHTVGLRTPLPVLLGYFTALPDEDGTMHFFNDLYGYDKQLEAALAKPRPYERATLPINTKLTPGETE